MAERPLSFGVKTQSTTFGKNKKAADVQPFYFMQNIRANPRRVL